MCRCIVPPMRCAGAAGARVPVTVCLYSNSASIRPAASTAATGGIQPGVTKPAVGRCRVPLHAPECQVHQHEDAERQRIGQHQQLLERDEAAAPVTMHAASTVAGRGVPVREFTRASRVGSCRLRAMP